MKEGNTMNDSIIDDIKKGGRMKVENGCVTL